MTSSPASIWKRSLPRAFGTAVVSAALIGTTVACDSSEPSETDTDETVFSENIDRIEIETQNGHIEFTASDSDSVSLEREFQWDNDKPASAEVVDGSTLRIELNGCSGIGSNSCGISYSFELPADVEVEAHTTAGNIRTVGMNASQELSTNAGNIEGIGVISDNVDASTRAGNATMHFVDDTDEIEVHSNAGNVEVHFTVPPSEVSASSDAGNVTVILPEGGTMYDVDASSNTHSAEVHVVEDDESERSIDASSKAGNVLIDYP